MENGAWINSDLTLLKARTEAGAGSVSRVPAGTAHGSGKVGGGRHLLVPKAHLQEPGQGTDCRGLSEQSGLGKDSVSL